MGCWLVAQSFHYANVKLVDNTDRNILATLPRCIRWINDALAADGVVLVHWYIEPHIDIVSILPLDQLSACRCTALKARLDQAR